MKTSLGKNFSLNNLLGTILICLGLLVLSSPGVVMAEGGTGRTTTIEVSYTQYEWWLVNWDDDKLLCDVYIDHPDSPTADEIYAGCGEDIYEIWAASSPCQESETALNESCTGVYLFKAGSEVQNKTVTLDLPDPTIWLEISPCEQVPGTEICSDIPRLMFTATEPLPNEKILQIQGTLNDIPFICEGAQCEIPLRPTHSRGVSLVFWADSSYGDGTNHYSGRIRVFESEQIETQETGWLVEVISEQSDFNSIQGCCQAWESFPPLESPPDWLANPTNIAHLETDEPLTYLAGQLIWHGYVDTSECEGFGLLENGYASQCGLERARPLVNLWQDNFDVYIVQSSRKTGIPSQLFKRIFARETQFWPETSKHLYTEFGLGHTNELGVDTTLLWNREFYDQFCPLILEQETCQLGYSQLDDWSQVLLRGALLSEMEIDIPSGGAGLDADQVQASVALFAETILANCNQVNQLIRSELEQIPGEYVSYEDLWKFTLVNYHSGSGCLAEAIIDINNQDKKLNWTNISHSLEVNCPSAVDYVTDIVQ